MNPEDEDTRRSEQPESAPAAEDTPPGVEAEDAASRVEAEDGRSGVESDQPGASPDQQEASVDDRAADAGAEEPEAAEDDRDPLEIAQEDAAHWRDKCLRTAADFDNYRKRSRREQLEADRRAREDLLRDILPVFDNLERAASHAETATDVKSLVDGIGMVMRQFRDTVAKLGVERIEAVGKPFDPALHEAIQHLETEEYDPGCVAAEVQAGYRMGDRLLRPAMVVVAKAKAPEPA